MRSLTLLILAALAFSAGCGGDSDSSTARTSYVQEMQSIQTPRRKTEELGGAMADPALDHQRWRRAADLWLADQRRALGRVRRITAPSDVSSLHARYVTETGKWFAAMERLVRSVQRGDIPRGQLERRATELGNRYAQEVGPIASEIEAKGYDVFQPFDSSPEKPKPVGLRAASQAMP